MNDDRKLRLGLILVMILSGFVVGRFAAGNNAHVASWVNASLCLFNLFGSLYLIRVLREDDLQDGE
jgi:hypothetical protein